VVDDDLGDADHRLARDGIEHGGAGAEDQEDRHARGQQAEEHDQEQGGAHQRPWVRLVGMLRGISLSGITWPTVMVLGSKRKT
jgi:hypothetical protein